MPKLRLPNRRRLLTGLAATAAAGAGLVTFGGRSANAYYSGPTSDHFNGRNFFNPGLHGPRGFGELLKWQVLEKGVAWPSAFASPLPPVARQAIAQPPAREKTRAVLIGHASFLIQAHGQTILIDPVWADRAGPLAVFGPRRANAPAIAFDDLPRIDALLLTHNHYDHMDLVAIARLWQRFKPKIVTPLGNDTILAGAIPGLAATALDWGDSAPLAHGLTVHAVQALHWSARGLRDRRHALWATFVLETPAHRLYCVGDTGFGDGSLFKAHGARFGGFDLALLPIGAYEPRWFMINQHMNPDDAVQALELLGAKRALGHHWGTFKLTNEGVDHPPRDLAAALARRGVAPERFVAGRPGEIVELA